ncbi:MAG TPA: aldehyde dehydrogenase family protein [Acidimicrobiales bacterium]|nr:aldehyde dehydrogenase family protein [Acidimicrobiales bacterium]
MSSPRVDVDGVSVSPDHYINGERIASSRTFEDRSPLDWTWKLADVARAGSVEADLAVTAAEAAFPAWAALSVDERATYLERLADLIDRDVEKIAHVECLDMAMLEESLRLRVVGRGARNFRAYAELARRYEPRRWSSNGTANTVLRMPAGPTIVITPWNAPFMLATWKCAPALASGNTVILKPAEWSPLSASMLMDLVEEAGFPPGVFNVVQGLGNEVGAALVADPRVRRISFTGSPETGRFIGEAAAQNLVPFTAELGGKGPFMVFADADLDAAAEKAAVMYDDGGQVCLAGTRLLVEASIRDEFVQRFEVATKRQVLGDSRDPATTISPLIHPDHLARVDGFVKRARVNGDTVVFGGQRQTKEGLWYEPTLIEPKSNDSEIVQREVFGPVLTIQSFADEREAAELANSTPYGLSAIVYTSSEERAERLGALLRAGTIWVNCFLVRDLTAPFGGTGISGIGREGGDYALDFYSDLKTLQIKEGTTHG